MRLMQRLLGWFRASRRAEAPPFPAMLRVRDAAGRPVPKVELRGVFEPTGRAVRKVQTTADGLCMVHWPREAERLRLRVIAGLESAEVEVHQRRPEPSRVIEVDLSS